MKLWMTAYLMASMIQSTDGLRCYTDIEATKGNSMECGLNSGCVKIFFDSEELLYKKKVESGYVYGRKPGDDAPNQLLPERLNNNPVLLRGCFVLAVPDRCYMSTTGLSYCWCSQKDLCNSSLPAPRPQLVTLTLISALLMVMAR